MVWCLYCQVFQDMGKQLGSHTVSAEAKTKVTEATEKTEKRKSKVWKENDLHGEDGAVNVSQS